MKRIIAWFVHNPIAANLLMAVLVVSGLLTLMSIRQEEFPSIDSEIVLISVAYLGATPEEVEEAVCVRIEEAIDGTPGIDRFTSMAVEGNCAVTVELIEGTDTTWALSELDSKVNGIASFPAETERPIVTYMVITSDVLRIAVSGDVGERALKVLAQGMRDDIAGLPGVSQVSVSYVRPYEISIEVSEQSLQRHGLSFDQVAMAVRNSSLDLPGGSLKTEGGEILLRSRGQAYRGGEFEAITVLTRGDGTHVTLGEIAEVIDGFRDDDVRAYFDGKPAVVVKVNRVGEEDILEIAEAVKAYVADARLRMPEGVELTIWTNEAESLRERVNALLRNAGGGLAMVLIVLALILRFRLALWVAAGIPISLLGAVAFFPTFDFAISTLAVMGFILVLGIVVDDAIVVGERIYTHEQRGEVGSEAAIEGTVEVAVPVIFGVLTTIAAFSPFVLVPGRMGQFFAVLGGTVILCLLMSLVEAQLVLPAHLAHRNRGTRSKGNRWSQLQEKVAGGLERFVAHYYAPALERVLEWRYLAISVAVGVMILTVGLFTSGRMMFQFFPGVEGDHIYATLTLPRGTPLARSENAVRQLEASAAALRERLDGPDWRPGEGTVRHVLSSIGQQVGRAGPPRSLAAGGGTHLVQVVLEPSSFREREQTTREIRELWRELTGPVPDAVELKYEAYHMHAGQAVAIQLASDDMEALLSASGQLREALSGYAGVLEVADSFRAGKQEIQLADSFRAGKQEIQL